MTDRRRGATQRLRHPDLPRIPSVLSVSSVSSVPVLLFPRRPHVFTSDANPNRHSILSFGFGH